MKFRYINLKEKIKLLFYFIKWLPGYYKLHKDYGYEPDTYNYIIENYEHVLCNRTKVMSKPTYHWKDVVSEIDRWYEDMNELYGE
jgi:hypothetical protein